MLYNLIHNANFCFVEVRMDMWAVKPFVGQLRQGNEALRLVNIYEGRPINKLQNSIILLIFKI